MTEFKQNIERVNDSLQAPCTLFEPVKAALPTTWKISLFNHVKDNKPKQMTYSSESFIKLLTKHDVRAKRDGKS